MFVVRNCGTRTVLVIVIIVIIVKISVVRFHFCNSSCSRSSRSSGSSIEAAGEKVAAIEEIDMFGKLVKIKNFFMNRTIPACSTTH